MNTQEEHIFDNRLPGAAKSENDSMAEGALLFGEYENLEFIGGGGMAQVYRARHRSLGAYRAIKIIRPELSDEARVESLFIREARALLEVHHDAVVRCHDLLRDGNRVYLVMEFVEGRSLAQLLQERSLTVAEVKILRDRLAAGLAAAHAKGVIHRDISPDNIILPDDSPSRAKLIDFGIAVTQLTDEKTMHGEFKGKLAYASPEQFGLFNGKMDVRSDLYSLGLVLAYAASGEPLAMGQTFFEAVERRKVVPNLPPQIPPQLHEDILPLLEPDPGDRPESAEALLQPRSYAAKSPEPEKAAKAIQPELRQGKPEWLRRVTYFATALGVGFGLGLTLFWWGAIGQAQTVQSTFPQSVLPIIKTVQTNVSAPTGGALANPAHPNLAAIGSGAMAARGLPALTRAQIIERARQMAEHTWVVRETNRRASCVRAARYRSDWRQRETVTGVAYDWGGMDETSSFDRKLAQGLAAGSHRRNGVTSCTTGIDCSGLVSYCWGQSQKYSTANIGAIGQPLRRVRITDLKPGDALNRPGKHIVIFAGLRPDGNPIVYEALGAAGRVIRNDRSSWARFRSYSPLRYKNLIDP